MVVKAKTKTAKPRTAKSPPIGQTKSTAKMAKGKPSPKPAPKPSGGMKGGKGKPC